MAIGQVSLGGNSAQPYVEPVGKAVFQGGEGIASALSGIAAKLGADEERLRLEDERTRKQSEGFAAATRWTEKQGEWARTQTDVLNNAPIDGAGLTNKRFAELRKDRDAFIKTLPEHLREEYVLKTEATLQDFATNTYSHEYKLRFDYQTTELTKSAGNLASEIRAGRGTMEAAEAEFSELLEKSALPEAAKAKLRDGVKVEFASAQFARIAQDAMERPAPTGVADGKNPVLSGIFPGERGLLNAAAADESGGSYSIIYGGGNITDFSDHPRKFTTLPNGQKSSAAGRYQIVASTWDDLVRRHGKGVLPDFSPASQDKAALILAEEWYTRNRSGDQRSFGDLMKNGSDAELITLKRMLAGSGDRTLWQAWQKMSDEKFLAVFKGQQGVAGGGTGSPQVPDVWNDPRFAGLSYDAKLGLADQARQAVNAINAAAEAQKQQFADQLRAGIVTGQIGVDEVDAAIVAGQLPSKEIDNMLKLVQKERDAMTAARDFANAASAGTPLDNSKENRDAAFTLLKNTGVVAGLQAQTPEAQAQLSTLFASTGVLPNEVAGMLEGMSRSVQPQQVAYAMDTLSAMRAKNPDMFGAAVSKEMRELEGVWAITKKYSPMGDTNAALERLRAYRDPAQAAVRETLRKEAVKQLETIGDDVIEQAFDPGIFTSGPSMPSAPQARGIMRSDFNTLYETYYPMFGEQAATVEFVADQMRHSWGVDEVAGNNRLMYLAPTSSVSGYPPIEGSYEWLRDDLLKSFGWDENVEFELLSDGQTEGDIKRGLPASYLVLRRDDTGQFRMESEPDGKPKRTRFTISPEIVEKQRVTALERNLEEKLQRYNTSHFDPQMWGATEAEVEATQAELDEVRRKKATMREPVPDEPFEPNYDFTGEN